MDINEMTMELLLKENAALKKINADIAIKRGVAPTGQSELVWITRDELKLFSDYHQENLSNEKANR